MVADSAVTRMSSDRVAMRPIVDRMTDTCENITYPVADPGFPRGGGANSPGGCQHTILPNFPKNCMKLKEFGPPGGGARPKFYYVDPPLLPLRSVITVII